MLECPICGRPSGPPRTFPFCSPRCAEVDLGRWFSGAYAVPADDSVGQEATEEDEP